MDNDWTKMMVEERLDVTVTFTLVRFTNAEGRR